MIEVRSARHRAQASASSAHASTPRCLSVAGSRALPMTLDAQGSPKDGPRPRTGALQVGAIPDGSRVRPHPGPKRSETALMRVTAGLGGSRTPDGALLHAFIPRFVRSTCRRLQWSRSSAENSSPRARPPDYDERSARRDHQASAVLRSRPRGWRGRRALRWQPSDGCKRSNGRQAGASYVSVDADSPRRAVSSRQCASSSAQKSRT